MKHYWIVVKNGGPLPAGRFLEQFDDGFSECIIRNGKIVGSKDLVHPAYTMQQYIMPFNLKGQYEYLDGKVFHRASPDGSVTGAIREAVFAPRADEEWDNDYIDHLVDKDKS